MPLDYISTNIEVVFGEKLKQILKGKSEEERKEWLKHELRCEMDTILSVLAETISSGKDMELKLAIQQVEEKS